MVARFGEVALPGGRPLTVAPKRGGDHRRRRLHQAKASGGGRKTSRYRLAFGAMMANESQRANWQRREPEVADPVTSSIAMVKKIHGRHHHH